MKNPLRRAMMAAGLVALLWPAGRALAACTSSLADTANADCVADAKCQKELIKAITGDYVAGVQKAAVDFINKSQTGKYNKVTVNRCTSVGAGSTSVIGKACLYNNGVCKAGTLKMAPCFADSDCPGAVPAAGACDRTKGCNVGAADDDGECQPDNTKIPPADATTKLKTKLLPKIMAKCTPTGGSLIDPNEIGLGAILQCVGIGVATTPADGYAALVDCLYKSGDVDTGSALPGDSTLAPFFKASLAASSTGITPLSKTAGPPLMALEYGGATSLQIGSGVAGNTSNNLSAGGNITPLSLAHCSGGAGTSTTPPVACVKNTDCGTGSCVANGNTAYTDPYGNTVTGRAIVGSSPLHKPPSSTGNVLTVTGTCSNSVSTCLLTRVTNAGNGTGAKGAVNLATGDWYTQSPIATAVYLTGTGGCDGAIPCPVCYNPVTVPASPNGVCSGLCTGGDNIPRACNGTHPCPAGQTCAGGGKNCIGVDQQSDQACLPNGTPAATIPNPFITDTGPKTMLPSPLNTPGNNIFCGACTGSTLVGCQVNADCSGVGGTCVLGAITGFHGDPTVTSITTTGAASLTTPLMTGLFCTGKTGSPIIDNSAGLPGPVLSLNPYIIGYVFQ